MNICVRIGVFLCLMLLCMMPAEGKGDQRATKGPLTAEERIRKAEQTLNALAALEQKLSVIELKAMLLRLDEERLRYDIDRIEQKRSYEQNPPVQIGKDLSHIKERLEIIHEKVTEEPKIRQWDIQGKVLSGAGTYYKGISIFHDTEGRGGQLGMSAYVCGSKENLTTERPFDETANSNIDFKDFVIKDGPTEVHVNGTGNPTIHATGTIRQTRRERCYAVAPEWRFVPSGIFENEKYGIKLRHDTGLFQWKTAVGVGILFDARYSSMQTSLEDVVVNGAYIGKIKGPELPSRIIIGPQPYVTLGEKFVVLRYFSLDVGFQLNMKDMTPMYTLGAGIEF